MHSPTASNLRETKGRTRTRFTLGSIAQPGVQLSHESNSVLSNHTAVANDEERWVTFDAAMRMPLSSLQLLTNPLKTIGCVTHI